MRVYRISKCKYIHDLSGYGAYLEGGRWNSTGREMLYTSQSVALCMLEILANLPSFIAPLEFCLLTLEVPDNEIQKITIKQLPPNWNSYPSIHATKKIGDLFLDKKNRIALQIPSSIIEQEYNILLNPLHPNFKKKVKVISKEDIVIDKRLKT
jgi:RES domain-containing protein